MRVYDSSLTVLTRIFSFVPLAAALEYPLASGFYAGYVASSFTLGRFLSGYFWGLMTDYIGRKPVIITGLLSIATFSVIFGMSDTYAMALTSR